MLAPVAPLLHEYVLDPVPPLALAVIDPVLAPGHATLVTVPVTLMADGAVTLNDCVAVHPLASVAVTEYDPARRLLFAAVVGPLLHT